MMKKLFLGFAVLTVGNLALALVDLKAANFSDSWIDMIIPGTGYDLKVQRGYNSRTLYNGIFGYGWCSEFETSLEITPEGNIKFSECGAGQTIIYTSKNFSEKDVDKTIKQIMAKYKGENVAASASSITSLERRLRDENLLRYEYASKYGITRQITDNVKFVSNGKTTDYIEKRANEFVRVAPDGTSQRFKLNGKLEKVFDRNGNFLSFTYDGVKIKDVTDNSGRKLSFGFGTNGKVITITGPGGQKVEYRYTKSDLVWAKNTNGDEYSYNYDELHNLVKVNFPDKTSKEIMYRKERDWVVGFKDVDGCKETYDYFPSQDNPKDHFWATLQKVCTGKTVLKARYEFWYDFRNDHAGKFLKRSKIQENDVLSDIAYNEAGKPLVVVRNGKTSKFEYNGDGLLTKRVGTDGVVTAIAYDTAFKKVSKITKGTKVSEFQRDSKGNLIRASNSDGQRVVLSYDNRGRIATIEDQAKRKVTIKYEERFGKPVIIERDGVGSINIAYNNKGDLQKVTSPGGQTVAVQVASTFSNLLDLIQPSGVALSL